jgi:hypothetical protein
MASPNGAAASPAHGLRSALTLSQLWAVVAVALPTVALLLPRLSVIDLAYLVRAGNLMLDSHQILRTDPFTFTVGGQSWLNNQWGAAIVLGVIHRAGGWPLLILFRAILSGAIAWLVYLSCRERGAGNKLAAFLTLGSFALVLPGLILRPQIFGLVLFALVMWLVSARARRPGALWLVPAAVVVWSNMHGSFFLGPVLVGLAWVEDVHRRRPGAARTAIVGGASVLATLLNPFGARIWSYAFGLSTDPEVGSTIEEWLPPTIRTIPGILFFGSVAVVVAILARRTERASWSTLLELGVFLLVGLYAARGIYWWGLAAPVALASELGGSPPRRRMDPPSQLNNAIAAMLLLLALAFLPWWRTAGGEARALLDHAPLGVTTALRTTLGPDDRMFNPQLWGSWFEWALPEQRTFVDSRVVVFTGRGVWPDYNAVSAARDGWQEILERWRITVVVAHPRQQAGLIRAIRQDPEWRLAYEDADGLVFARA